MLLKRYPEYEIYRHTIRPSVKPTRMILSDLRIRHTVLKALSIGQMADGEQRLNLFILWKSFLKTSSCRKVSLAMSCYSSKRFCNRTRKLTNFWTPECEVQVPKILIRACTTNFTSLQTLVSPVVTSRESLQCLVDSKIHFLIYHAMILFFSIFSI